MLQSRGAQKSSVCITTAERCLCAGLSSPRRLPPTESRALNWLAFAKACCGEAWDAPASQCDSAAFSQAADQLGAQVPYRAACSDLTLQVGACPKMLPSCTTTSETAHICLRVSLPWARPSACLRHMSWLPSMPQPCEPGFKLACAGAAYACGA